MCQLSSGRCQTQPYFTIRGNIDFIGKGIGVDWGRVGYDEIDKLYHLILIMHLLHHNLDHGVCVLHKKEFALSVMAPMFAADSVFGLLTLCVT